RNLLLKTAIFTTILLSLTQNLFAFQSEGETTTIEGTVYDTEGVPLPGVTVLEKNTTNGVQMDFDGNYSMDVNSNQAILIFSYVGMKSQEIVVGNQQIISITLENDLQSLDEVVLVGYGRN